MNILIDTREQKPLEFSQEYVDSILRCTFQVGDYGVQYKNGYEPPIYFERKSISDLFGTMGKGYPRFKKQLLKAKTSNKTLILIIEGTFSKVLKGYERSDIKGISMIKKLFTLWRRYNLMPVFCKDRKEMSAFIYSYYCAIGREAQKDLRDKKRVQTVSHKGKEQE